MCSKKRVQTVAFVLFPQFLTFLFTIKEKKIVPRNLQHLTERGETWAELLWNEWKQEEGWGRGRSSTQKVGEGQCGDSWAERGGGPRAKYLRCWCRGGLNWGNKTELRWAIGQSRASTQLCWYFQQRPSTGLDNFWTDNYLIHIV